MALESIKGSLKDDVFLQHKFRFSVAGLMDLYALEVSEIDSEIGTVDLPDGTTVPTGIEKPGEITITTPTHHKDEQAVWTAWMAESRDPILPSAKKAVTVQLVSLTGKVEKMWTIEGAYPYKMTVDAVKKNGSESEFHTTKWALKYDAISVLPI